MEFRMLLFISNPHQCLLKLSAKKSNLYHKPNDAPTLFHRSFVLMAHAGV